MTPPPTAGNPNHALKLMITGRRKPGTTLAEHRRHIRQVHGEMVLKYIAADPAVAPQRYAQNAVFDGQFRATMPGVDPFALNRDFITQIWFADMGAMARSLETAFYKDHLKGDEDNFVDQKTVVFMPTREREMSLRAGAAASAPAKTKLFFFVQRTPTADADAFKRAWTALPADMTSWPVAARIQRHVQNDVLPRPNVVAAADGVDEFWVDDDASAVALLMQWQARVRETLVRPGLAEEAGHFGLLAHEDLIHAGTR